MQDLDRALDTANGELLLQVRIQVL